jgi:hypothetical protein
MLSNISYECGPSAKNAKKIQAMLKKQKADKEKKAKEPKKK